MNKPHLFTHKCDTCGKGMDEGHIVEWPGAHLCSVTCLLSYLYNQDISIWTTWDVKTDTTIGDIAYDEYGNEHIYKGEDNE